MMAEAVKEKEKLERKSSKSRLAKQDEVEELEEDNDNSPSSEASDATVIPAGNWLLCFSQSPKLCSHRAKVKVKVSSLQKDTNTFSITLQTKWKRNEKGFTNAKRNRFHSHLLALCE